MALHSSTFAWKNPMDGGAWWAEVHGVARVGQTEGFHFHLSLSCIGEGNGNPLQCSCLENPRDGEVSWAAIYGVAQSRTRLKRLSSSSSSRSDFNKQHTVSHISRNLHNLFPSYLFHAPFCPETSSGLSLQLLPLG